MRKQFETQKNAKNSKIGRFLIQMAEKLEKPFFEIPKTSLSVS